MQQYTIKVETSIRVSASSPSEAVEKAIDTVHEASKWLDPHDMFEYKIEE